MKTCQNWQHYLSWIFNVQWVGFFTSKESDDEDEGISIRKGGGERSRGGGKGHGWVEAQWRSPGQLHDRKSMLECLKAKFPPFKSGRFPSFKVGQISVSVFMFNDEI